MSEISCRNVINGEPVPSADGQRYDLVDPSTGEVFATAPLSGAEDVDAACRAAEVAFESWGRTTPAQRQQAMVRFADLLEDHGSDLVELESLNTGKPLGLTASEELPPALDHLRFFAGAARVLEGRSAGEYMEGHTSYVRREPIGVVGQVAPWNYPMLMAIWKIAPAIAAGNTVVLKPSDTTPLTAVRIGELAAECFPPGVVNVVCGDRQSGREVIANPRVAMVSITGSTRAGREVATTAAADVKRVHLELGGKAPVVVFDDVDIEKAVEGICEAAYFNAGQDCQAATRVLVGAGVADDFVAALAVQASGLRVGPPSDADAFYGPLNNANQLAHVSGVVSRLPDHAEIVCGGAQVDSPGYFWQPTVVSGLRHDDEAVQAEIFGPVITVQTFADEAEAIRLANGVEYGLAASVWTRDHGTAMRVSSRIDSGTVWVNCHIPLVAEMPHGGFKHSGYGKDLSVYGLEDYTRIKHVMHRIDA
jgi:betaine-aldehyde dehydrogenase